MWYFLNFLTNFCIISREYLNSFALCLVFHLSLLLYSQSTNISLATENDRVTHYLFGELYILL